MKQRKKEKPKPTTTMIYVDETDPVDDENEEPPFEPRNVCVKKTNPTCEYTLGEELGR